MSFLSCFIGVYCYGLRRFICNEDLDTLEVARRRYRLNVFILYLMTFTRAVSASQTNDNFTLPTHVGDLRRARPHRVPSPQLLRAHRRRHRVRLAHQSNFRQDGRVMSARAEE